MQTELQTAPAAATATDSLAAIRIDLLHQLPNKIHPHRKYFATAAIAVAGFVLVLLYQNFSWLNLGLSLFVALQGYNFFCSLSGKSPLWFISGSSYLILDEKGIVLKQRTQKQVKIDWAEIDTMYVHLFSTELILKNDDNITIVLESLTDENLQLVKERLQVVKQQWQI